MLNVFILTATHTYDKMLYNEVYNCLFVKHIKGGLLNNLFLDILVKFVKTCMTPFIELNLTVILILLVKCTI